MELRKGYKTTEIGLIPYDWEVKTLGEIGTNIIGLTYSPNDVRAYGNLVLRSSNIQKNRLAFDNNVFVEMKLPERVIVRENDILICVRNGSKNLIGKCALIDKTTAGSAFGAFMSVYRTNYAKYIFHQFQSNVIQKQIDEVMGATINQLTNKDLATFKISLAPTHSEQIAITTTLSDADSLINSLEKLITKKRNIKQGAMQKMLQIKEGSKVTRLGDVCIIRKGQLITDSTKIHGSIPVIAGGKKPAYYHNVPNRTGKTITISGSGASAGFLSFHDYPIFASDCSTIEEGENYSIEFIFYILQLSQEMIYKMQTGGAQPHIHPRDLNPLTIYLPLKDEQIKIANVFLDMDAELKTLQCKLEKYQNVKAGMMQNLLTGKIRLV